MPRKAVQNAENRCVKKFNKHCVEQTKLFVGCDMLPDGFKVDVFSQLINKTPYWIELKYTTKYDINYMRYYGALMEKDKLTNIKTIVNEVGGNGMYLRFLKDGWMCWDINDITTLSEDNKQRKAVKVSTRIDNVKKTPYWLLDWRDAKYIYNYDGVDMKQVWLGEEEWKIKRPIMSIDEVKQRLHQHKVEA